MLDWELVANTEMVQGKKKKIIYGQDKFAIWLGSGNDAHL